MEEQECEIVFVSNKSPKKENILEALAKYKLKCQQEQQQHTMEAKVGPSKGKVILYDSQTLSIKGEVSNQTSKGRKGNNISLEKQSPVKSLETRKSQSRAININQYNRKERNRLTMEYVQNSAKSDNKPYLKNDFEVGITEYISQGQGFSADVNHSDDDFKVHEISLDGSLVHLTKMLNPLLKPNHCEDVISDLLNSIDDILLKTDDEEIKTIEIDITGMDKIGKNNLQKILKENFHFHVHQPVSVAGGRLILNICRIQDEKRRQNGSFDYVQFVLYIEKLRTTAAIDIIAKKLRKSSACFMTAENKIARSISQLVTMKREDCIGLCLTKTLKNISIGNFSFAPKPLQRGDLKGNHFNIALRKILGDKGHIEANLRSLKDNGFINYCESEHFLYKSENLPKHLIGKHLLLKQWQEAIDLILQPPELKSKGDPLSNVTLACIEYKLSRVVRQTFKVDVIENSIKAKLLSIIKTHGENLIEAVNAIPLELRLSFVRAYQCFLWNTIVSKRLAKFGSKLIVGDLVYASVEMEGDRGRCDNNRQHNQREVIFIDKNNIHKYTIYDVVLPLPGCNITYPANEVAVWYKDLLLADGLLQKDFNSGLNTYGINGAYRPVVLRPSDLKWKFVHYDNPDQSLIPSDLDRLQQIELPSVSSQEGAYLGLVLEFSLPAFAWGTMALREILKVDIIAGLRNSTIAREKLKNRLKRLPPRQKLPSPLATKEVLEESQMKKIREKPCIADQPLSETSKSFLDINQNHPETAANQLSKGKTLREIKPESDTVEKQPSIDNESLEEPPRTKRIAEKQVTNKQFAEQRKNQDRSPSTTESQLKGITLEPATLENLTPTTREPFEKPLLEEEPGTSKHSAPIDFAEELQTNQIVLQPHTCQKPSKPIVNECLEEPQTNVKVESGICQMHSSTFTDSCEEPEKKKIKLDLDTDQEEELLVIQSCTGSKFKSIIYIDLISDQED